VNPSYMRSGEGYACPKGTRRGPSSYSAFR
jgi:hypothetical protein